MFQDDRARKPEAKRLILVIEDGEINRTMLRKLLENDFDIIEAENGVDGFKWMERRHKDLSLVLLDVYMPLCNGFEFLEKKRADERFDTIPVVVTTDSVAVEDELACLALGANDFVMKPYDFEVMLNRINNLIRLRESASLVNQLTWDSITELYVKDYFFRLVEKQLADDPERPLDLICSYIDDFKRLNVQYGEESCDSLLKELSARLVDTIPSIVTAGRIAGDMFAFLVDHQGTDWDPLLRQTAEDLPIPGATVSFGIVDNVDPTMSAAEICKRAEIAIDAVKEHHNVQVSLFNDDLHQHQLLELAIREGMENALSGLEFKVYYQPKHDVHIDRIGGAEALVRWSHPEIGFISPGSFIPIFEKSGFITKLDLYVLEQTCRELVRCQKIGLPIVPVSFNVSRRDFDLPDLPKRIVATVDKYGIDHSFIHIEVTETAYADDPELVVSTLTDLSKLGFAIELDDFGTGYSSLVSLNTLPLDVMKIDMSIIHQAAELDDFRIVESTINLARTLNLETVVEGVETEEEMERVKELGCDLVQGYFYSKPLTQLEFEAYLAEEK